MKLPFTVAQFLRVFALYNQRVWPAQIALNAAAVAAIVLLLRTRTRARGSESRVISAILGGLWAWMAVAYHFLFFTAINPAAWLFGALFLVEALALLWFGVLGSEMRFYPVGGVRGWSGALLILFALVVYPLLGYALGHRYPAVPTFGVPCPTTIFTLGLLLFAGGSAANYLFVIPLLWSAIGSFAAFRLNVSQDFGLLAAGIFTLALAILTPAPSRTPQPPFTAAAK
jgi:Family of unknown function (DUF6064)